MPPQLVPDMQTWGVGLSCAADHGEAESKEEFCTAQHRALPLNGQAHWHDGYEDMYRLHHQCGMPVASKLVPSASSMNLGYKTLGCEL